MNEYQVMPPLSDEEYAELKSDIAARGVMVPIEFDEHGNVLDGHHRLMICNELGINDYPKVVRAGMTESEKRTHARKLNMARRQLNQEQRRELIREQLRETPEKSDRQIANSLGVDHKTVSVRRNELEGTGEIPQLASTTGADGKERPRQVERKQVIESDESVTRDEYEENSALYDLDQLFIEHPVLSDLVDVKYKKEEIRPEPEPEHKPHVSNNSGCNEWYTPQKYVELVRDVLGVIELDPASCEYANRTVKAEKYFSLDDDGLTKEWRGRVWMNPPYGSETIAAFVDKFVDEYNVGNITEGIVLVNNATETGWFRNLASVANGVVFPQGRIRYESSSRESLAPLQGQAFLYFGTNADRFFEVFSEIGWGAIIK